MTQTLEPTTGPDQSNPRTPTERVERWLADFESALRARDIAAVSGMFATDCFWRDLVAFTWNLKTVEGREQLADMLTARLDDTDPGSFASTETPTEDDGVVTTFLSFETATGRGDGVLRAAFDQTVAVDQVHQGIALLVEEAHHLHGLEHQRGALLEDFVAVLQLTLETDRPDLTAGDGCLGTVLGQAQPAFDAPGLGP